MNRAIMQYKHSFNSSFQDTLLLVVIVAVLHFIAFNSSFQDTVANPESPPAEYVLSIPHFRIQVGCGGVSSVLCTFNSSFQDTIVGQCLVQRIHSTFNSSFQDTVLSGLTCTHPNFLSIPHFRIQAITRCLIVYGKKSFNSSFQDTFAIIGAGIGYFSFQFLILGYSLQHTQHVDIRYLPFNSSFQDTRCTECGLKGKCSSFNSSFQDT